jgi:SAM-dependent methyltransferase
MVVISSSSWAARTIQWVGIDASIFDTKFMPQAWQLRLKEESLLQETGIPLSGAHWAAKSEAYAALVAEHIGPRTLWLDAGCGWRLLEEDMEPLEDWLAAHCGRIVGLDLALTAHRNIRWLVQGSIYSLPFADSSIDLVTFNMVAEHLDDPARAFSETARCLRPGGALIIKTPNLLNYGVMGNAVMSRVMPEKWRRRLVYGIDGREAKDFFPVRYKANTMRCLVRLLRAAGFNVHKTIALFQKRPYLRKTAKPEKLLMRLTPVSGLLLCAHKSSNRPL